MNDYILMNAFRVLIIMVWLCLGLYYGISGYLSVDLINLKEQAIQQKADSFTVDNITYDNIYAFRYAYNSKLIETIFPYIRNISDSFALIVSAMAFGTLGAITRVLKQLAFENIGLPEAKVFSLPLLGMLSGIFILGITYVIPSILVSGDQKIRPETLVFFALFSGLFCKRFYDWLSNNFDMIFKNKEK